MLGLKKNNKKIIIKIRNKEKLKALIYTKK